MIHKFDQIFHINTKATSLIIRINENHHLTNEYYGSRLPLSESYEYVNEKIAFPYGTEVIYDEKHPSIALDQLRLEYGTHGKGDYREPAIILQTDKRQVLDFKYLGDEIIDAYPILEGLPLPHHPDQILRITLSDNIWKLRLDLFYGVFYESNVIARHVILHNDSDETVTIDKIMSLQLDLDNHDYELVNLYGGWGAENQQSRQKITPGIYINDSKTGNSSNRHNPFFMLVNKDTLLNAGPAYGINLMYSGNHYEMVEATSYGKLRLQIGINPFLFHYELKPSQAFETPLAIMSYAHTGQNGLAQNMHHFINHHVISGPHANRERPIVLNNWEATYFKFNEAKLLSLLKDAKQAGIELFVLDDGWFGQRIDDTKGLGDYDVNRKKLPRGLDFLADKANTCGLKFGLWFEPEMVNEQSKLFESHPDWAIRAIDRTPSYGRHQLVLDLSRFEVQSYLIDSISKVLDSAHIEYVKWDMNRHISDFESTHYRAGELYHRYIKGLYHVLNVLTKKYDYILWEGCASGGNRFDLGMLCYFQQIWTSDDTDAFERLHIQSGTALGYPLSVISAHVAASPSHQALRRTPIETRFHVASFGVLGYELDLRKLDQVDFKAVKDQISFYKKHRSLFQYGRFYQLKTMDDSHLAWMVQSDDKSEALIGYFNKLQTLLPHVDTLPGCNFVEDAQYEVTVRSFGHRIKMFGGLINHVAPIPLNEEGVIVNYLDKHQTIEELMKVTPQKPLVMSGAALNNQAYKLGPQWAGTGFNEQVRVLGDFGSEIYYIRQIKNPGMNRD